MQSKLVQTGVSDSFFADLQTLSSFPKAAYQEIVKASAPFVRARTEVDKELVLPIANKFAVSLSDFSKSLGIAVRVLMNEDSQQDPVIGVLRDAVELGKIDKSALDDLTDKLEFTRASVLSSLMSFANDKALVANTFPTMSHLSTRCAFVPRIEPGFNRAKDNAETYTPQIASIVPIAVVQIDIQSFGETAKAMSFGLLEEELGETIDHLRLALKELTACKQHLKIE